MSTYKERWFTDDLFGVIDLAIHKILYARKVFPKHNFRRIIWKDYYTWLYPSKCVKVKIWDGIDIAKTFFELQCDSTIWIIIRNSEHDSLAYEYMFQVKGKNPDSQSKDQMLEYLDEIKVSPDTDEDDPDEPDYEFGIHVQVDLSPTIRNLRTLKNDFMEGYDIYLQDESYACVLHQENLKQILEKEEVNPLFKVKEYIPGAQTLFLDKEEDVTFSEDSDGSEYCCEYHKLEAEKERIQISIRRFYETSSSGPFIEYDMETVLRNFNIDRQALEDPSSSDEWEDVEIDKNKCIASVGENDCLCNNCVLEDSVKVFVDSMKNGKNKESEPRIQGKRCIEENKNSKPLEHDVSKDIHITLTRDIKTKEQLRTKKIENCQNPKNPLAMMKEIKVKFRKRRVPLYSEREVSGANNLDAFQGIDNLDEDELEEYSWEEELEGFSDEDFSDEDEAEGAQEDDEVEGAQGESDLEGDEGEDEFELLSNEEMEGAQGEYELEGSRYYLELSTLKIEVPGNILVEWLEEDTCGLCLNQLEVKIDTTNQEKAQKVIDFLKSIDLKAEILKHFKIKRKAMLKDKGRKIRESGLEFLKEQSRVDKSEGQSAELEEEKKLFNVEKKDMSKIGNMTEQLPNAGYVPRLMNEGREQQKKFEEILDKSLKVGNICESLNTKMENDMLELVNRFKELRIEDTQFRKYGKGTVNGKYWKKPCLPK